ncbi:hypothetical protein HKBW3S25_01824, partial [Candidatus Hakubella thermalkaliphila]
MLGLKDHMADVIMGPVPVKDAAL